MNLIYSLKLTLLTCEQRFRDFQLAFVGFEFFYSMICLSYLSFLNHVSMNYWPKKILKNEFVYNIT